MPDDVPPGGGLGGRCRRATVSAANATRPDDVPPGGGLGVAGTAAERPLEREERETQQQQ